MAQSDEKSRYDTTLNGTDGDDSLTGGVGRA